MRRLPHSDALRSGLTLLELMLAMVLMAVILTATWSLLGAFGNRLEKSQRQTEQWQLIRSLQQRLADDLLSCQIATPRELRATRGDDTLSAAPSDPASPAPGLTRLPQDYFQASLQVAVPQSTPTGMSLDAATPPAGAVAGSQADVVVRGAWLDPESFLLGTSQALMFDVVPAAPPQGPQPPLEEPPPDQAAIPDTVRRVVYAFHDPLTAARTDRLPGLVRCELTIWQLTRLRQQGGAADLLTWLRPAVEALQPAAESPLPLIDSVKAAADPLQSPSTDDALAQLHSQSALGSDVDLHLEQHLDYAPELAMFQLRYYDGAGWQASWDSRQQGQLPVAIEVRFQLTSEVVPGADGDDPAEIATSGESAASALLNSPASTLEPLDDPLRSAQTRPPEDHRFLIFLRDASGAIGVSHAQGADPSAPDLGAGIPMGNERNVTQGTSPP
jgi:prepilin-type N-terminal cleavage/methylation domain-containing protein